MCALAEPPAAFSHARRERQGNGVGDAEAGDEGTGGRRAGAGHRAGRNGSARGRDRHRSGQAGAGPPLSPHRRRRRRNDPTCMQLRSSAGISAGCRPGFFLPVRVLSRLFRRLFIRLVRRRRAIRRHGAISPGAPTPVLAAETSRRLRHPPIPTTFPTAPEPRSPGRRVNRCRALFMSWIDKFMQNIASNRRGIGWLFSSHR